MSSSLDRTEFGFDIKKASKKLSQDPAKPLIYLGFFLILAFLLSVYVVPFNLGDLKGLGFLSDKKETETEALANQGSAQNSLSVTSPAKGDNWGVGTTQNIVWQYSPSDEDYLFVFYRLKNQANWTVIKKFLSVSNNSYSWSIPDSLGGQAEVFVGVSTDGTTWATYDT